MPSAARAEADLLLASAAPALGSAGPAAVGGARPVGARDVGDEAVAAAVHGADDPLGGAVVADGLAGGLDPAGERRLADEPVAPHLVEQLGLGHHPVAVRDEVGEHVEHLRLDVDASLARWSSKRPRSTAQSAKRTTSVTRSFSSTRRGEARWFDHRRWSPLRARATIPEPRHTLGRTVPPMARVRLVHRCTECGATHPKWAGRCPTCDAWNTLVEDVEAPEPMVALGSVRRPAGAPRPTSTCTSAGPPPTGIGELDRVLGGGLVAGSVTLLGGEPGVGKSTLLTQLLLGWRGPSLYVSAEESAQQVRLRAGRLGPLRHRDLWVLAETSLPHILDGHRPAPPDAGGRRQHPDHRRPRARVGAGQRRAGARLRATARRRGQGAGPADRAGRSRHQGGWAGRATGARAHRRHRAQLRGRPPPRAAPAARRQAPLRLDQRARRVRARRRRTRGRARRQPAVPHRPPVGRARLGRHPDAGRPPPAAGRGAGADQPGAVGGAAAAQRAGPRRRAAGAAARRARAPARRCRWPSTRCSPRPSAACG